MCDSAPSFPGQDFRCYGNFSPNGLSAVSAKLAAFGRRPCHRPNREFPTKLAIRPRPAGKSRSDGGGQENRADKLTRLLSWRTPPNLPTPTLPTTPAGWGLANLASGPLSVHAPVPPSFAGQPWPMPRLRFPITYSLLPRRTCHGDLLAKAKPSSGRAGPVALPATSRAGNGLACHANRRLTCSGRPPSVAPEVPISPSHPTPTGRRICPY